MPDTLARPADTVRAVLGGRRVLHPDVLLGAALTAAYAVVLLLDLSVPQPVDHSRYMDAARAFPARPNDPIFDHQYLRIGLTGPTALAMRVFGYSEVTYHAFPIATALLLFASVYAIGREDVRAPGRCAVGGRARLHGTWPSRAPSCCRTCRPRRCSPPPSP